MKALSALPVWHSIHYLVWCSAATVSDYCEYSQLPLSHSDAQEGLLLLKVYDTIGLWSTEWAQVKVCDNEEELMTQPTSVLCIILWRVNSENTHSCIFLNYLFIHTGTIHCSNNLSFCARSSVRGKRSDSRKTKWAPRRTCGRRCSRSRATLPLAGSRSRSPRRRPAKTRRSRRLGLNVNMNMSRDWDRVLLMGTESNGDRVLLVELLCHAMPCLNACTKWVM